MRSFFLLFTLLAGIHCYADTVTDSSFYSPTHPYIRYTGRISYTEAGQPRYWAPGVYLSIRFKGTYCVMEINDEERWGKSHNYLQVIVDNNKSYRVKLKAKQNRIVLASGLKNGIHTIVVCKDTEAEIGYLQPVRFTCSQILKPAPSPKRKIEFIGNSITCGMGNDDSEIPCKSREWYDQHNAYMAYGPRTARSLDAQWHLSSVSGIGLIHSCCNKTTVMPEVFDKINMTENQLNWDFNRYQPDVVTVCLGQNDGIQDSTRFCNAYRAFISKLRSYYPSAYIVLLNSPMADQQLDKVLKKYIGAITASIRQSGDEKITSFFFSSRYASGCDSHPDMKEHGKMAEELSVFLRQLMHW